MLWALSGIAILILVFAPQLWVRRVLLRHSKERTDIPGTGGELARHLLDSAGLDSIEVEATDSGDHYDPSARKVRLTPLVLHGRSLTAVAVAAHEVGHALQHADGYRPLTTRTHLVRAARTIEIIATIVLAVVPVMALVTHAPPLVIANLVAGFALMALPVVVHLVTLPVELDASFARALPILDRGNYLEPADLPAVRRVLQAAAMTYVAASLASLLNVMRWFRGGRI